MPRHRTGLMFLVMVITGVVSVAAAILARDRIPLFGEPVKVGPRPAVAPVAAMPFLIAGYWVMFRIYKADTRANYERSLERPESPSAPRSPRDM